jgi:hypothetical protein
MQIEQERPLLVNGQREPVSGRAEHYFETQWAHCVNMILGAWLISAPASLGYQSVALAWSDVASGLLILVFGAICLSPRHIWAPWAVAVVGLDRPIFVDSLTGLARRVDQHGAGKDELFDVKRLERA